MAGIARTTTVDTAGKEGGESNDGGSGAADRRLAAAVLRGDRSAQDTLVRHYGPAVLSVARRYMGSEADAADVFQETFIAVIDGIGRFEGRGSLQQWVCGVAIRQSLMALRRSRRRRERPIEELLPRFDERGRRLDGHGVPAGPMATQQLVEQDERHRFVREQIDALGDDYRLVLLLRDIDGYSTRETADILGIRVNAVKTRLHRARSALRTLVEPVLREEPDGDA